MPGGTGSPPAAIGSGPRWSGCSPRPAKLAGEAIGYADEVEACYGVRPARVEEDVLREAHRLLDEVLPGTGPLAERLVAWREAHAVPVDRLRPAIDSLAEDLRAADPCPVRPARRGACGLRAGVQPTVVGVQLLPR